MIGRLLALIKKEFLAIRNDKKSLFVVIVPPMIQVLIFSFAATLEVKHVELAVLDKDGSAQSRELIRTFAGSAYVHRVMRARSYADVQTLIDRQRALMVVVIPDGFAAQLGTSRSAIQVILDGRRANTAQIALGYLNQMVQTFSAAQGIRAPVSLTPRNFYNANLDNFLWIVPHLFGSITMVVAMILTALSIARERELGTLDQVLVSPLRPLEILLGKLLPALLISVVEATVILIAALLFFGAPLVGSPGLLYLGVIAFLFSISGVGLFISTISRTQQQAILGAFVFLLPSFLLSGFATPVRNMPEWLQPFTDIIPLKYFLQLIKGVMLKGIGPAETWPLIWPMLGLGVVFMLVAVTVFRRSV